MLPLNAAIISPAAAPAASPAVQLSAARPEQVSMSAIAVIPLHRLQGDWTRARDRAVTAGLKLRQTAVSSSPVYLRVFGADWVSAM